MVELPLGKRLIGGRHAALAPPGPPSARTHTPTHPHTPAECIYAPYAARGFAREFVKDLEVGGAPAVSTVPAVPAAVHATPAAMPAISAVPAGCGLWGLQLLWSGS